MSRPIKKRPVEIPRPILYYSFNDDFVDGTVLRDVMGANNATLNGGITTGVPGRLGQSFLFDGATGFTETTDDPLFEPHVGGSGTSTWCAVVNWSGGTSGWFTKNRGDTNQREFYLFIAVSGEVRIHNGTLTNSARGVTSSTVSITTGVDTHIAITYDASGAGTEFIDHIGGMFINGVRVPIYASAADIGSFTAMSSGTEPVRIGKWIDGAGVDQGFFNGSINELQWFAEVLTDDQIAELSARSLARKPAFANVPVTDYDIWWSARDVDGAGNTTLSTPNVATLTDHGTLGVNATQGTSAKQPFLRPFRSGSRPGILFDGIDDVLTFASQSFGDFTMLCVIRTLEDITTSQGDILLLENNAQVSPWSFVHIGASTGAIADEVVTLGYNEFAVDLIAQSIQNETILSSKPAALMIKLDGTRPTLRYDTKAKSSSFGSLLDVLTFDSAASQSLVNITSIGGRDTSPKYSDFILHEMLLYSRALTESEIIQVENWMAEEYPDLDFQQLVFATNPDTTVEDEPVTVNVEAAGAYPEPIAYWSMDNSDIVGTTIIDQINGANGTASGTPSASAGPVQQARSFNGSTDYYTVSQESLFDFEIGSPFTLAFWLVANTTGDTLLSKWDWNVNGGWTTSIDFSTGGRLRMNLVNSAATDGYGAETSNNGYDDSQWHHAVVTYGGGDASSITWYVDGGDAGGTLVQINTDPGPISNNTPVHIGARLNSGAAETHFDGEFDEVAIWNRELTANEAFEVYKRGAQGLKLVE